MARSHSFDGLQKTTGFDKALKTEKPLFLRVPQNVQVCFARTKYNDKEHLTLCLAHPEEIEGTRRSSAGLTVEVVQENEQGNMKAVAEAFIVSPTFWFVGTNESRVTVPEFFGNEKAHEAAIAAAEQYKALIADMAKNLGITPQKAEAYINASK